MTSIPISDAEVSTDCSWIMPPSTVNPDPLFRPPPPELTVVPMRMHSDSQRIPSFHPVMVTDSIVIWDQTARSPTEVESDIENVLAICESAILDSTSRRSNPSSSTITVEVDISKSQPEMVPMEFAVICEASMPNSPAPAISNKVELVTRLILFITTLPLPLNRANTSAVLFCCPNEESRRINSPSICASIQFVVPSQR